MPKLIYAVLSSDVIVDRDTGSATLVRVLENVGLARLPGVLPPLHLVSSWEQDAAPQPFNVELRLLAPDGGMSVLGNQVATPKESKVVRYVFLLQNLAVQQEGRHAIVVALRQADKALKVAELPLFVIVGKQSGQART